MGTTVVDFSAFSRSFSSAFHIQCLPEQCWRLSQSVVVLLWTESRSVGRCDVIHYDPFDPFWTDRQGFSSQRNCDFSFVFRVCPLFFLQLDYFVWQAWWPGAQVAEDGLEWWDRIMKLLSQPYHRRGNGGGEWNEQENGLRLLFGVDLCLKFGV